MMNLDGVRAGGEGVLGIKKDPSGKDKNVELNEAPKIFRGEDKEVKFSVPEGWSVGE